MSGGPSGGGIFVFQEVVAVLVVALEEDADESLGRWQGAKADASGFAVEEGIGIFYDGGEGVGVVVVGVREECEVVGVFEAEVVAEQSGEFMGGFEIDGSIACGIGGDELSIGFGVIGAEPEGLDEGGDLLFGEVIIVAPLGEGLEGVGVVFGELVVTIEEGGGSVVGSRGGGGAGGVDEDEEEGGVDGGWVEHVA